MSTATSRRRCASLCDRDGLEAAWPRSWRRVCGAWSGRGAHGRATSRSSGTARPARSSSALAGMAGEGEEHVVERRLTDLHVIDSDSRLVERAHDCARQPTAAVDRRAQAPPVLAHVHGTGDERTERGRCGGMGLAERELQARPADLRLQLGRGAAGDHAAVVDHHDPVGELVGLVEVLGRKQQRHAIGDEPSDHVPHPHPARGVQAGRRLVEEQHRRSASPGPAARSRRRRIPPEYPLRMRRRRR